MEKTKKSLRYHTKDRHATWLELFFDLVFVASIDIVAHKLSHTHHGHFELTRLMLFPVEFLPIWWIWATHTLYANRFDTDSREHRFASLTIMFLIIIMSAFIGQRMFEEYEYFVCFYVVIRLILAGLYLSSTNKLRNSNRYAKITGLVIVAGAFISSISVLFPSPVHGSILIASILVEMTIAIFMRRKIKIDPIDCEHFVERIGLFFIILLGESVTNLVISLNIDHWNQLNVVAALSGFIMIGAIWWIFYDSFQYTERIKDMKYGYTLLYSSMLFSIGLIILANLIRHTIINDLDMYHYRISAFFGIIFFLIGKEINYYQFFPPMRPYIWINSIVCITMTIISTLMPRPEYALVGMTLSMLFYVFVSYTWTMKRDISAYLE